ncbi:pyridoxamine 5'-phosphate oxidase family protein [Parendozoicomonas sp. Alg238-R29]|uniref:pyridoxamine 5'-phosphate oxidase family protein n=1 Tax=Parendozoicomonas sp. Alg238-R29 TaxID=2993446 RepID=UPI00248DF198|nr:pyridoxamine 5'-phosphate oxidase family protein [Parendozoicomonas sp. Alg238-R29]
METLKETEKTKLGRARNLAVFDREMLYQVFDEALLINIGFAMDGQPFVLPTLGWRVGNKLYTHGNMKGRMMEYLINGAPCCVTATLIDGMVLGRSAFNHSTNYRSAMVFGSMKLVDDPAEKEEVLRLFVEHIAPGRAEQARPPSVGELKATAVLSIEIEEASVKVRKGPPNTKECDRNRDVWAGEMVMRQVVGPMVADELVPEGMVVPDYSAAWGERWES